MKIRHKLTLYFSLASALIILIFGIAVYFFSAQYRKNEFFLRLKTRLDITERLFVQQPMQSAGDGDELISRLPEETEEIIPLNNNWEERTSGTYPSDFLKLLDERREAYFYNDSVQGAGRVILNNDDTVAIVLTAVDKVGNRVLGNLRTMITLAILISVTVISILSYYISKTLIWPISRKIQKANTIGGTNLHERLIVYNPDDELGEMAIAFNKLLDRLEGAFRMQKLFIANASHEIKNPLTAILGEAEVTLDKERTSEEYRESLKNISLEADRLSHLINNLFQLSSVSDSTADIKRMPIMVFDLISESRKKHDLLNPGNQLQVYFDPSSKKNEPVVYGNRVLLETALINIMDNASKFSSHDKVDVFVTIVRETLIITIEDRGVGIPENDLSKINQPFFRAENVRQIRGTGIGIPLTLRIVELHRGKLEVKSQLNKGTTVKITLPLAAAVGDTSVTYPAKASLA